MVSNQTSITSYSSHGSQSGVNGHSHSHGHMNGGTHSPPPVLAPIQTQSHRSGSNKLDPRAYQSALPGVHTYTQHPSHTSHMAGVHANHYQSMHSPSGAAYPLSSKGYST